MKTLVTLSLAAALVLVAFVGRRDAGETTPTP